jgi:hypothetical protein
MFLLERSLTTYTSRTEGDVKAVGIMGNDTETSANWLRGTV